MPGRNAVLHRPDRIYHCGYHCSWLRNSSSRDWYYRSKCLWVRQRGVQFPWSTRSPDEETLLDPYAAEAPEEFFAVASEAFFVAPHDFRAEHPRFYELLRGFFRQDPAAHC